MSHYIRTIHTDYTRAAPSSSSSSTHTPLILNMHPHADQWRSSVSSGAQQPSYTRRTRRAPSVSARRTAPPPPPPRTSYAYMKFDPFSDEEYDAPVSSPVLYRTPRVSVSTPRVSVPSSPSPRVSYSPPKYTPAPVQPAPAPIDPNARSRLVAGILLNRVHAVGRPMRRRSLDGPREYVKSGLSSVISVEA